MSGTWGVRIPIHVHTVPSKHDSHWFYYHSIIPSFFFFSHKTDSENTHLKRQKEARETQRGPFCDSRTRTRKSCVCIIFLASLLLIWSPCFMLMKRTFLLPFRCSVDIKNLCVTLLHMPITEGHGKRPLLSFLEASPQPQTVMQNVSACQHSVRCLQV